MLLDSIILSHQASPQIKARGCKSSADEPDDFYCAIKEPKVKNFFNPVQSTGLNVHL